MLQEWLDRGLSKPGKTQRALAKLLGVDPAAVSRMTKGFRQAKVRELATIAGYLDEPIPAALLAQAEQEERAAPQADQASTNIPEVDARTGAGLAADGATINVPDGAYIVSEDQVRGTWSMPLDYLRFELRVPKLAVRLVEVIGDSMQPTLYPGDRIMVNTADRRPSPPGIFALWDGLGLVVKRVEHIPNTDPLIYRISSDNPHHATYERTEEEVNIVGRVVWYGRRI